MKIFFDLDGTLIDSRERLYRLFRYLVPSTTLSFGDYWELKRNKIGHAEILRTQHLYSSDEILLFENSWLAKIELPEWLAFDKPFDGVTNYLMTAKKEHLLYLVTARQFESAVFRQITEYGWSDVFEKVFVTGQKLEKRDLIQQSTITKGRDWFVGDTGKDIQTGKYLGMRTAAVLTGFLSKEKLRDYNPDLILESVLELKFE